VIQNPVGPATVDAEPVNPILPVNPVGPVGPTTVDAEPVKPVGPVGPVFPKLPVKPLDPTKPTDPVKPLDPMKPTDPVNPVPVKLSHDEDAELYTHVLPLLVYIWPSVGLLGKSNTDINYLILFNLLSLRSCKF